jgi:hypothetical protein
MKRILLLLLGVALSLSACGGGGDDPVGYRVRVPAELRAALEYWESQDQRAWALNVTEHRAACAIGALTLPQRRALLYFFYAIYPSDQDIVDILPASSGSIGPAYRLAVCDRPEGTYADRVAQIAVQYDLQLLRSKYAEFDDGSLEFYLLAPGSFDSLQQFVDMGDAILSANAEAFALLAPYYIDTHNGGIGGAF